MLSVAGLYAHFYTVFTLAFHGVFALWLAGRSRRWWPLMATALAQAAVAAAFLPWGQFVVEQIRTNDTYWRGTLALGRAVSWLLHAFAVGETYSERWATPATVVYVLLALAGGMRAARQVWSGARGLEGSSTAVQQGSSGARRVAHDALSSLAFVSLYVAIPIVFLLALSYNRPKFAPRYLLSVTPAYYLLVGCGMAALLQGPGRIGPVVSADEDAPLRRGRPSTRPRAHGALVPTSKIASRLCHCEARLLRRSNPQRAWRRLLRCARNDT